MRFGRILLAFLAPLLSVSPALKADVTPGSHAPAVDSLLNLLRSVAPAAVTAAESGSHHGGHAFHVPGPASRPFLEVTLAAPRLSLAAEANLHRIERQHLRLLLRC
jgi:hypothetical protein